MWHDGDLPEAESRGLMSEGSAILNLENGVVRRLLRGMGAGMIGQVLSVLYRLLLPPLFLKAWGVDTYGDWLLVTAMVAHLALTDVGGGVYVINRLTQLFFSRDVVGFRRTLQTALGLLTVFPAAIALFFIGAFYIAPDAWLSKFQFINGLVLKTVAAVLALQMFVSIPHALILGIYRAVGELPRGAMLANGVLLLQLILVGCGLSFQMGPVGIALLQVAPIPTITIWAVHDLNRRWSEQSMFAGWVFDRAVAKDMLHPSFHFFLIQLSLSLSIQGTLIVAGLLLGAAQVVVFSTMRTLANVIKSMLAIVSHAAWPDVTRLYAEADYPRLNILFGSVLRTNICATVIVSYILMVFGKRVYQMWLGELGLYDPSLMTLILIFLALQVTWGVYGNLLMATNRHHQLSILTMVSSVLSIVLAYLGALGNGIEGMLLGMILAELLPMVGVPFLACRSYLFITPGKVVLDVVPLLTIPMLAYIPSTALLLLPALAWWWWRIVERLFRAEKRH